MQNKNLNNKKLSEINEKVYTLLSYLSLLLLIIKYFNSKNINLIFMNNGFKSPKIMVIQFNLDNKNKKFSL